VDGRLTRRASALWRCARWISLASALAGCADLPPTRAGRPAFVEPVWTDVFDPAPPLVFSFRPQSLQADPLYGPLLRKALALVRLRSRAVATTHAIDAIEDADEVICGARPEPGETLDDVDLVVAIVGVRADIDPAAVVDASGHPLWAAGPPGKVRELVRAADADWATDAGEPDLGPVGASLFELPGRTWVIASGLEASRAREAFAHPRRRASVAIDRDALAALRIDGPSLVARIPFLHGSSALAPIGGRLRDVAVVLGPGRGGELEATLAYADPHAAALAEGAIQDVIAAFRRKRPDGLTWIGALRVGSSATSSAVTLSTTLPAELTAALRNAGGSIPAEIDPDSGTRVDAGPPASPRARPPAAPLNPL
jgi:hypothetical protein